jgi:hypothetical protein
MLTLTADSPATLWSASYRLRTKDCFVGLAIVVAPSFGFVLLKGRFPSQRLKEHWEQVNNNGSGLF